MTTDLISVEAEQTILGALIQHPESWKVISGKINRFDFAMHDHAVYWGAIGELAAAGNTINPMTVTHKVGKEHWQYISDMCRASIGATDIERFAEIVKERSVRRRVAGINAHQIACESLTAAEAVGRVRAEIDRITADAVQTGPKMINELMEGWKGELENRKATPGGVRGIPCGIESLDLRWSGLCGGQMIVVAGRPGNGKTTLALNIGAHVAASGHSVLVFSFEMHDVELTDKIVSASSGAYLSSIKTADLSADDWGGIVSCVSTLKDKRLAIDTGTSRTIDQIRLTCRAHALRHGLDLVIVDYLQQVSANAKDRRQEVELVSRGLKLMALEMKIPVIAVSQMSRAVESRSDKRPQMSDLRESGAIEQDADIVAFCHRPDLNGADEWKGYAEIITAKSRHTEPGTDVLVADLARSRFKNYSGAPPQARNQESGGNQRKTFNSGKDRAAGQ